MKTNGSTPPRKFQRPRSLLTQEKSTKINAKRQFLDSFLHPRFVFFIHHASAVKKIGSLRIFFKSREQMSLISVNETDTIV